jgi:hypothetical protein
MITIEPAGAYWLVSIDGAPLMTFLTLHAAAQFVL